MLSPDTYRARFDATIASLRAWTGFIADVARIEVSENPASWRLMLVPHTPQACPVELILRRDQLYDISISTETHEDLAIESMDAFLPLLEAVSDGRVLIRTRASQATGLVRAVETIVTQANGQLWQRVHLSLAGQRHGIAETVAQDRHFAAYRR
jgi:hypothetical protein